MMKRFVLASFAALLSLPVQASDVAATYDSGEVTGSAITSPSIYTQKASNCTVYVDNFDGNNTRTLDVACLDPEATTVVYTFEPVTIASASRAAVIFDPQGVMTGQNTTRFAQPCAGRTRLTLSSLSTKKATMMMICHK